MTGPEARARRPYKTKTSRADEIRKLRGREPTVNENRAIAELPLDFSNPLNDNSEPGRKIQQLLITSEQNCDVSLLEEAGHLLFDQSRKLPARWQYSEPAPSGLISADEYEESLPIWTNDAFAKGGCNVSAQSKSVLIEGDCESFIPTVASNEPQHTKYPELLVNHAKRPLAKSAPESQETQAPKHAELTKIQAEVSQPSPYLLSVAHLSSYSNSGKDTSNGSQQSPLAHQENKRRLDWENITNYELASRAFHVHRSQYTPPPAAPMTTKQLPIVPASIQGNPFRAPAAPPMTSFSTWQYGPRQQQYDPVGTQFSNASIPTPQQYGPTGTQISSISPLKQINFAPMATQSPFPQDTTIGQCNHLQKLPDMPQNCPVPRDSNTSKNVASTNASASPVFILNQFKLATTQTPLPQYTPMKHYDYLHQSLDISPKLPALGHQNPVNDAQANKPISNQNKAASNGTHSLPQFSFMAPYDLHELLPTTTYQPSSAPPALTPQNQISNSQAINPTLHQNKPTTITTHFPLPQYITTTQSDYMHKSLHTPPSHPEPSQLAAPPLLRRCARCCKMKKGCDRQSPCQRCKDAGLSAEQCIPVGPTRARQRYVPEDEGRTAVGAMDSVVKEAADGVGKSTEQDS